MGRTSKPVSGKVRCSLPKSKQLYIPISTTTSTHAQTGLDKAIKTGINIKLSPRGAGKLHVCTILEQLLTRYNEGASYVYKSHWSHQQLPICVCP